ncbi:hypothetical protein [uncultured Duncaniella sp.]|nr:hypothetical protein [uncultured Duncaniella sp.]
MEGPCQTVLGSLPALSLTGSQLAFLVHRQKALERVYDHVAAIHCAV